MTTRQEIEQILRDTYGARQRGDLDALSRMFSPQAEFGMAGSDASPIATRAAGAEQYRPVLAGLIKTFEIQNGRISSFLQFCDTALVARLVRH